MDDKAILQKFREMSENEKQFQKVWQAYIKRPTVANERNVYLLLCEQMYDAMTEDGVSIEDAPLCERLETALKSRTP
jgi:hypothetical protein